MRDIELIHIEPFRIPPGSIFDFRLSNASPTLARSDASNHAVPPSTPRISKRPEDTPFATPVHLFDTGEYSIAVDGHEHIEEATQSGVATIPALVFRGNKKRELVVTLAIAGKDRTLSGVEKVIALYKINCFAAGKNNVDDIPLGSMPGGETPEWIDPIRKSLIGRPVSNRFVSRLMEVLTLPAMEIKALHDCGFTVDSLMPLLDLDSTERELMLKLHRFTHFTVAEGREIVRLIILARGRVKFELSSWAKSILSGDPGESSARSILKSLERQIHPELTAKRRLIEDTLKSMKLPNRVKIKPPENLEGDSFSCYFRFSQVEELRRYIELLQKAAADGTAEQILGLLRGDMSSEDTPHRDTREREK